MSEQWRRQTQLVAQGQGVRDGFVEFAEEDIERSVPERFEQQVRLHGDRIAVKGPNRTLTYDEFNARANQVAWAILDRLGPDEEPVGLLLGNGIRMLAGIFGALKAGKIYVPLDLSSPSERTNYILQDAGAALIVTDDRHLPMARRIGGDGVELLNLDEHSPSAATENPDLPRSPDGRLSIIYTSGSTGRPKGVIQNHRNTLWNTYLQTNALLITPEDRLSMTRSPSFAAAVRRIYPSLLNGASLRLYDVKTKGMAGLAEWIRREEVTMQGMRTIFREFTATLAEGDTLPSLRILTFGGDTIYRDYVERGRSFTPADCVIVVNMASTEAHTVSQYFISRDMELGDEAMPVGYPVDGVEVLLLDEGGEPVRPGQEGQIHVRSRYLSPGYWNLPDLTEKAYLPDPEGGDLRIFRTGDMARMAEDGLLTHMGRKDFQIKVRGYTVQAGEVEMGLRGLDAVDEAIVVSREDRPGDRRLVAYFTLTTPQAPTVTELRQALVEKLPDYMVPAAFVALDEFPRTATGKVDRRALPAPGTGRPDLAGAYAPPRTPVEGTLAAIWADVLRLDRVGVHDSFLELGGNSLLAVQLFTQVERVFGRKLPLATLFESPTVEGLARVLREDGWSGAWKPIIPVRTSGSRRPFFCVAVMDAFAYVHLARHLDEDQPFYVLHPLGLLSLDDPDIDVQELAAQYVEEVRAVQPEGPYFLGGMCSGGTIAYEMAQQLVSHGQEVALLALIDTPRPGGGQLRKAMRLVQRTCFHLRALRRQESGTRMDYLRARSRALKRRLLGDRSAAGGPVGEVAVVDAYWRPVRDAYRSALPRYVPEPYAGSVTMFLGAETPMGPPFDRRLAWRSLLNGADVHMVPGDHTNMLRDPNVRVLAEKLSEALRSAQDGDGD